MPNHFDVCHTNIETGLTLLEAGAGTGKTYSLVRIIARHLVENDLKIDQILTVTFTRAATAEIKSRLHELLSDISACLKNTDQNPQKTNDLVEHWRQSHHPCLETAQLNISTALANFDSAAIFTIDGFFQRLIKEFAFEANSLFSVELDPDEKPMIQAALRDYWRQHVYSLNSEKLEIFRSYIKFDDTLNFVINALPVDDDQFDPRYRHSANEAIDNYAQHWRSFTEELNRNKAELIDFCQNPPIAFATRAAPFRLKGTKTIQLIEDILRQPENISFANEGIDRISYQYLKNEASLKKGKNHPFDENVVSVKLIDFFQKVDRLLDAQPQGLKSAYLGEILQFTRTQLHRIKTERHVQSYTDITHSLASMLDCSAKTEIRESLQNTVRQRYRAGLIDEFQDTSPKQCSIFLNLFHDPELFFHIIGDPKQSIYRFRGADVFSYIQASQRADRSYELLTNYRSSARMIHAVNQVFKKSSDPFLVEEKITFTRARWPEQDETPEVPLGAPALHLHTLASDVGPAVAQKAAFAHCISSNILSILGQPWSKIQPDKKGVIEASDIAVLVRTGKEGNQLYQAISRLNIPVTLNTRTSLIESNETRELFSILSALLEPRKADLLRTALLTAPLNSGKWLMTENQDEFDRITYMMAEFHRQWQDHGLMPMILNFVRHFDVRSTLLRLSRGQRKVTNFMHLVELLDEKARQESLSPSATLQWLEMAIQGSVIDVQAEALELRISTDDSAVQIITQHSCKGLEFPIVLATCSCPQGIAHPYPPPRLNYHHPSTLEARFAAEEDTCEDTLEQRRRETLADAVRLAYVALTRSQYLCHYFISPAAKFEHHAVFQMLETDQAAELQLLAEASSGCIAHHEISANHVEEKLTPWQASGMGSTNDQALGHRRTDGLKISRQQRTTSFTGITRNTPEIAHDNDSNTDNLDRSATTMPPTANPTDTKTSATPPSPYWDELQAGASLGLVFHETLEEIDFQAPQNLEKIIERKLFKYSPWRQEPQADSLKGMIESIGADLKQLMSHSLGATGISLNEIPLNKRITEPEFLLSGCDFGLASLAAVLAEDPPTGMPTHYANLLKSAPKQTLDGYLKGFIDLIFEHNGRYHLLDWKTNRLPNYQPETLADSMADHHYYLQYHLYSLALDRFLSQRLGNDYRPEQHLGEIFYVYLRGVTTGAPGSGIFRDRLSPLRLAKLREAFCSTT